MEYIHKAKAEKSRTKVLSDQMEARRIKNKVRHSRLHPLSFFLRFLFRRLSVNVVLPVSLRNDRASTPLSKRRPRSRYWSVPFDRSRYMIMHVTCTETFSKFAGQKSKVCLIFSACGRLSIEGLMEEWRLIFCRIWWQRCLLCFSPRILWLHGRQGWSGLWPQRRAQTFLPYYFINTDIYTSSTVGQIWSARVEGMKFGDEVVNFIHEFYISSRTSIRSPEVFWI